jgi:hypothetical protein
MRGKKKPKTEEKHLRKKDKKQRKKTPVQEPKSHPPSGSIRAVRGGAIRAVSDIREGTAFESGDFRQSLPRFSPEALRHNQALVERLREMAARHHSTPAQIALAWLLAQRPWVVPIPGTTRRERLDENIGALSLELGPQDLEEITALSVEISVRGDRYPEKMERMTGL